MRPKTTTLEGGVQVGCMDGRRISRNWAVMGGGHGHPPPVLRLAREVVCFSNQAKVQGGIELVIIFD